MVPTAKPKNKKLEVNYNMTDDNQTKFEKIASKIEKRYTEIFLASLIVIAAVSGVYITQTTSSADQVPEGYAETGNDTVYQSNEEAAKYFNITDVGVSPASQTVNLSESVGFNNQLDEEVSLSFDRSNDTVNIEPRSSRTLLINGITYFEVQGDNYSAQGRVNVQ